MKKNKVQLKFNEEIQVGDEVIIKESEKGYVIAKSIMFSKQICVMTKKQEYIWLHIKEISKIK